MKFLLTLYACISFTLYSDAMYYGEYRTINDLPYMAQIQGYRAYCSGAILSADWIISAAHCVGYIEKVSDTKIITRSSLMSSGGRLIDVSKIFVHGDRNEDNYDGDICLLKLATPLVFDNYQQPIEITKKFPNVGDNITVAGYGIHHHNVKGSVLRSTRVPIIENKHCDEFLRKFYNSGATANQFCTSTEEVELCPGDSGGPAVFNNQLIGVFNFGCDNERRIPNGFTKIANYYDWIMQITGIEYDI